MHDEGREVTTQRLDMVSPVPIEHKIVAVRAAVSWDPSHGFFIRTRKPESTYLKKRTQSISSRNLPSCLSVSMSPS